MFSRVLVANRGDVAVRVIRALHEIGAEAVAVYSTADAGALHTRLADRAVCIGPPPAAESYLSMPSTVAAAEITPIGADNAMLIDQALANGDEHVIKFTEACLCRDSLAPSPVYRAAIAGVLTMLPGR